MKPFVTSRKKFNYPILISAFALGVICTLLIGAVTGDSKMGLDLDRAEPPLKIALDEALAQFHSEMGSDRLTISKSELLDYVELGYWFGVYSQSVNRAPITAYFDFDMLEPEERRSSLGGHRSEFVAKQCEKLTNRFAIVMRKKFENNDLEFRINFGELQSLLAIRADSEHASVVCPFEDAGLDLYDLLEETEDEAR